ncbi:MAG: ABC transporter substrate-binding protein [Gemmatimonadota bacterium]|nr:ABC transporter substrate-binding protein [Gemmatimonadota bacterium]
MRIASLLASATEIVCALDLEDRLVAISHECDHPPHVLDRPRVSRPRFDPVGLDSAAIDRAVREAMAEHGSVYVMDTERLHRVAPDLLLTQGVCEVCAVPPSLAHQAAQALGGRARVLSLDAHTVDGILASIESVAAAAAVPERADRVVARLRARIAAVRQQVAGAPRPRVLAVEWLEPPFAPGHWGPEMVTLAGGLNLVGAVGARSQEVSWAALADLDPDVLLIMPCGYGLAAARTEADRHAERLRAVAPRAVRAGRAWVLDGSAYFNRSGPRVVDGVEILGRVLHPDRCPDVPLEGRAAVWAGQPGRGGDERLLS